MESASHPQAEFEYSVLVIGSDDVAAEIDAALQSDDVRANVERTFYMSSVAVAPDAKCDDTLITCVDPRHQIIIVDVTSPNAVEDRVTTIARLRNECPSSEIVVVISTETESQLVRLLQAGAWYFLSSPLSNSRLALILLRVVAFRETDKLVRIDGLTGLFNRAFFDDALRDHIARIKESGGGKRTAALPPMSLVLADIDNLNDTHGRDHEKREALIRDVGRILRETYRATDVIARIGGNQFAVLLVGVSYSLALMRAEIIRKKLSAASTGDTKQPRPTFSVGVVTFPAFFDDANDLLDEARTALDAAKAAGGDVVFGFDRSGTPRPFRELGA